MTTFHYSKTKLSQESLLRKVAYSPHKFNWFLERGYNPHYYQILFHSLWNKEDDRLTRFRHLVAGRRGGKTLSAAWEVIYYALHPKEFHWDAHRLERDTPLHIWVLTPDYRSAGRAALFTLRRVLRESGLTYGKDYSENKSEKWIEFENGTILEFKTAERPEQLVGAGLDLLWLDEAAIIPDDSAWQVARPALSDKEGLVVGTTTPRGKNWYYELFWGRKGASEDPDIGHVEYRSIDNPYFPRREWETALRDYHPIMFKREYMASFDSMAGVELSGEWLRYYTSEDLDRLRDQENPDQLKLNVYMGVDPAISLSDQADYFAMAVVGVTHDFRQAFLLDLFKGRIPFPEQVDLIREYHRKWRPHYIGIETNAYQAALAQQLVRLEELPPIAEMPARGKKEQRILAMGPVFNLGRIKIRKDQTDFIEEWLNYDSQLKNPKDDCLDAVEIALRSCGALLPEAPHVALVPERPAADMQELAERAVENSVNRDEPYDEHLGAYF